MEVLYLRCAGLDVHADSVTACIRIASGGEVAYQHHTVPTTTRGLLELADRLTADVCTPGSRQPIGELQQSPCRGWNGVMLIGNFTARRDSDARRHRIRMDIESRAAKIQHLHRRPPSLATPAWSPQGRNLECALTGQAGVAIRGARGTPGPAKHRALGTIEQSTSVPASPRTLPRFMPTRVRRQHVGS